MFGFVSYYLYMDNMQTRLPISIVFECIYLSARTTHYSYQVGRPITRWRRVADLQRIQNVLLLHFTMYYLKTLLMRESTISIIHFTLPL